MVFLLSLPPLGPWQTRRYLALVLPSPSITCPKMMEGVRKISPCSCVFTSVVWVKREPCSLCCKCDGDFTVVERWFRRPSLQTSLVVAGLVRPMMSVQNSQLFQPGDIVSLAVVSWQSWTFPGHLLWLKTFWKVGKHGRVKKEVPLDSDLAGGG